MAKVFITHVMKKERTMHDVNEKFDDNLRDNIGSSIDCFFGHPVIHYCLIEGISDSLKQIAQNAFDKERTQ